MERMQRIFGHINQAPSACPVEPQSTVARKFVDSDDDVVVVSALRTPICKAARGQLKDTLPDDLLSAAFTAVINDAGLDPAQIQDICVGNVNQPGAGAAMARIAQFFSNIPETVPLNVVNRQCSSGLQAVANIANSIKAGVIDIGIGAGVESMSVNPMRRNRMPDGFVLNPKLATNELAQDTLIPMGITSENVAEKFGITREKQDQMAMESHQKAAAAWKNGWYKDEIIPVRTNIKDKDGNVKEITVQQDDGIRPTTTMEVLAKLKPAFKEGGSTTAGNASQISDGAAAVVLARRSYAKKHHLPVLGTMRSFAVVGVPPSLMGIGPAYAIPEALKKAGLKKEDVDIYEINEAFASQATYCMEKLGLPRQKVNPKGGAIAIGHPLGCTGARQVATVLHELKRRGGPGLGIVSMCIGSGMGAAAVFEYAN